MAGTEAKSGDALKFLTQKIGPLPLYAWAGAAVVIWWYLQRKQAATAATAPNQQTDPAGNVGSIDPSTGYVYGTPEDQAALTADSGAGIGGSAGQNATTGAQAYADNNSWGIAAVNYLTGKGVNGTDANTAIENYLNSQVLTTAQQGLVNLAIAALGAPPTLPAPATAATTTGAASSAAASTGTASSAGTASKGSAGNANTSSGAAGQSTVSGGKQTAAAATTATITWVPHGRANSWRLTIVGPGPIDGHEGTTTVPVGVYSGLQAGHNYRVTVIPLYNGTEDGPAGYVDIKTT